MKPDVVVDVGNSRIKWGCAWEGCIHQTASLRPNQPEAWESQLEDWVLCEPLTWAVSGVHPDHRDRFVEWLRQRGDSVWLLESAAQLPLLVLVDHPDRVGIDRLLNAVASRSRALAKSAIIIDAGTAVTVDLVSEDGTFQGGAILPGFHLMARALHDHTARLPLVVLTEPNPPLPGKDTAPAIRAGIFWAAAGGVRALVRQLGARARADRPKIFLTGGDAALLAPVLESDVVVWPEMTLEGIRLTAEAQP
jgi:type III pantothenate kinase